MIISSHIKDGFEQLLPWNNIAILISGLEDGFLGSEMSQNVTALKKFWWWLGKRTNGKDVTNNEQKGYLQLWPLTVINGSISWYIPSVIGFIIPFITVKGHNCGRWVQICWNIIPYGSMPFHAHCLRVGTAGLTPEELVTIPQSYFLRHGWIHRGLNSSKSHS